MPRKRSYYELRCFCRHTPLLATYGLNSQGKIYIHVKIYKSGRVYGEVYVEDGASVRLHCRDCLRWHRVVIRQPGMVNLQEDKVPASIDRGVKVASPMIDAASHSPLR